MLSGVANALQLIDFWEAGLTRLLWFENEKDTKWK